MEEPNDVTRSLLAFNAFDTSYVLESPAGPTMASADATSVMTTPRETIDLPGGAAPALDVRKAFGLRDLPTVENLEAVVAQMPAPPTSNTAMLARITLAVLILWTLA